LRRAVDVGKKIQENPLITRRKLTLGSLRSLMNIDRLSVFGRTENDQRKKPVTVNERHAGTCAIFKPDNFAYPLSLSKLQLQTRWKGRTKKKNDKFKHAPTGQGASFITSTPQFVKAL